MHPAARAFLEATFRGEAQPMAGLDPDGLCLIDLPLLVRGAERVAVLATGGLPCLLDGAPLLAALREACPAAQVAVFASPDLRPLLDGFLGMEVDARRYWTDPAHQADVAGTIAAFAPHLVVNLDRERRPEGDDLAAAASPAGGLAFVREARDEPPGTARLLDAAYRRLLARDAPPEELLASLGLRRPEQVGLWPEAGLEDQARSLLASRGWAEVRPLALLVDHPSVAADPACQELLALAAASGHPLLGLGGIGARALLEGLLKPFEGHTLNLAGQASLGLTGALLGCCAAFLGGSPPLQRFAGLCGCRRYIPGND